MKSELIEYFTENSNMPKDELAEVIDLLNIQKYPKGKVLLHEGEVSTKCFFIIKGCVRRYKLEDGEEKTTAFFTENQSIVQLESYLQQQPSSQNLICVEEVIAIVGDPVNEQEMYRKFPKLESLTRMFLERDFGKNQEDFSNFITSSPEKRYLDLMRNRPDLLQRVPQHQIASYLGVTPESLSRIRRRIAEK